jgi:hypothetical protein
LARLESQNVIAPIPPNRDADTNPDISPKIAPGPQLVLDGTVTEFVGVRPRRTRKANVLNLNACICGITITDNEIQNNEASETIMKCRVLGCETVWVSEHMIY